MINKQKVIGYLGLSMKAGKLILGADACEEAIQKRKVKLMIVAEDASERTKKKFQMLCESNKIEYIEWGKIEKISKAIGKNNKAVIGMKDKSLSEAIKKVIIGGESIG